MDGLLCSFNTVHVEDGTYSAVKLGMLLGKSALDDYPIACGELKLTHSLCDNTTVRNIIRAAGHNMSADSVVVLGK